MHQNKNQAQTGTIEPVPLPEKSSAQSQALGYWAVHSAHLAAHHAVQAERYETAGHEERHRHHLVEGSREERDAKDFLEVARKSLTGLTEEQSNRLDAYLNEKSQPFMQHLKEREAPDTPWAAWLSTKKEDLESVVIGTTDEQFLNFLQGHIYDLEQHPPDPSEQEVFKELKGQFKQAAQAAAQEGWLGANIGETHKFGYLEHIKAEPGDFLTTTLVNKEGWTVLGGSTIVYEGSIRDQHDTVYHELTHVSLDSRYKAATPLGMNATWLREALNEHTSSSLMYGAVDMVNPEEREQKLGIETYSYNVQRLLLENLLKNGKEQISPRLGTKAHTGNMAEQIAFVEAVNGSWGDPEFMKKLSHVVDTYTEYYRGDPNALAEFNAHLRETSGEEEVYVTPLDAGTFTGIAFLGSAQKDGVSVALRRLGFNPDTLENLLKI